MFLAFLSTFLNSWGTIFRKKSLSYKVPAEFFNLLSHSGIFLITLVIYFLGYLDFSNLGFNYIAIIFVMCIFGIIRTLIAQKAYKLDKISTLMPYENINKILSIILAFLIFGDISFFSFIITLIAAFLIILFSIDFKTFKIPKSIKLFSFSQLLTAILTLIMGFLVKELSESAYFITSHIVGIILIILIVIGKKQYKVINKIKGQFYVNRLLASHFGGISYIISIYIIKNLGLSISILLSFIGVGITLLFSYLVFRDKPGLKDIILVVLVSILVGLGYLYK